MTVSDIVAALHPEEFQRIIIKSKKWPYGLLLVSGGYVSKILKTSGNREVVGYRIGRESLILLVEFQESDLA